MESNDGRYAYVVADEYGCEDEGDVHHHAVGRDAVFTQIFHQLEVIADGDDVHGDAAHIFRQTVAAGFSDIWPDDACWHDA